MLLTGAAYGLLAPTRSDSSSSDWTGAATTGQQLQDRALQAYRQGDARLAIPALRAYLTYLESLIPLEAEWKPGQSPWLDRAALASERMLVAGRLASLLEQRSDSAEADRFWEKALQYARESGRPDVSLESVREAVARAAPAPMPDDLDMPETR